MPADHTIPEAARFLHERGLLFEINRAVLHPLGLALSAKTDDAGTVTGFGPLIDYRDDPEGMLFSDRQFEGGMERLAKGRAECNADEKAAVRLERFGSVIQEP